MGADLVLSGFLLVLEIHAGKSSKFSFTQLRKHEEDKAKQNHHWIKKKRETEINITTSEKNKEQQRPVSSSAISTFI